MSILTLIKPFRVSENVVKVLYSHKERSQEFVIEWNNIHPSTGEAGSYNLQIDCLSNSENLNSIVETAIRDGEVEGCDLYIELRDTFDSADCESLQGE